MQSSRLRWAAAPSLHLAAQSVCLGLHPHTVCTRQPWLWGAIWSHGVWPPLNQVVLACGAGNKQCSCSCAPAGKAWVMLLIPCSSMQQCVSMRNCCVAYWAAAAQWVILLAKRAR